MGLKAWALYRGDGGACRLRNIFRPRHGYSQCLLSKTDHTKESCASLDFTPNRSSHPFWWRVVYLATDAAAFPLSRICARFPILRDYRVTVIGMGYLREQLRRLE